MKVIQEATLEAAIDKFDAMDDDEAQMVIDEIAEEQPFLLAYSFAVEEEFEEEEAFELFLEYTAIVWLSFKMEFKSIRPITEDEVIAKDEQLQEETLHLASLPEEQMIEAALEKFGNPTQPVVMNYVYQQMMDLQEEDDISEESASAMVTNLSFVVELLDEAVNKPGMQVV